MKKEIDYQKHINNLSSALRGAHHILRPGEKIDYQQYNLIKSIPVYNIWIPIDIDEKFDCYLYKRFSKPLLSLFSKDNRLISLGINSVCNFQKSVVFLDDLSDAIHIIELDQKLNPNQHIIYY